MPAPTIAPVEEIREQKTQRRAIPPDTYITLSGIDWQTFEGIADRTRGGRVCYDNGELEIMSPSYYHEDFGDRLRTLVEVLCEVLDIEAVAVGSTTWKAPEALKGVEADASYYLDPAKIPIVAKLAKLEEKDITRFPDPDLVIEIDLRVPDAERSAVYAAVRAVEVWEFDGKAVRILRPGPDGSYAEVERSGRFPISAREIEEVLAEDITGIIARRRAMRAFLEALIRGDRAGH